MFTATRAWIELDEEHRPAVVEILARHHRDPYSHGRAIPERSGAWQLYVLDGTEVPDRDVPRLRLQVEEIAALQPVDPDGDLP